jgi:hypothetical protein
MKTEKGGICGRYLQGIVGSSMINEIKAGDPYERP